MKLLSLVCFSDTQQTQISSAVSAERAYIPFQWESPPDVFHLSLPPTSGLLPRHTLLSQISRKKITLIPSPVKPEPFRPVLEHLYCRKAESATGGNKINSVKLSTENFPLFDYFFFPLTSSTPYKVLHICHISPQWSFPGLTIPVSCISPYNTAAPYPHNCPVGFSSSSKAFPRGTPEGTVTDYQRKTREDNGVPFCKGMQWKKHLWLLLTSLIPSKPQVKNQRKGRAAYLLPIKAENTLAMQLLASLPKHLSLTWGK